MVIVFQLETHLKVQLKMGFFRLSIVPQIDVYFLIGKMMTNRWRKKGFSPYIVRQTQI